MLIHWPFLRRTFPLIFIIAYMLLSAPFDSHAQSSADQIVYAVQTTSGSSDLYVVNADGSGAQQLTHNGVSSSPAWSPGHRQIAYRFKQNDVADIYVMNANGSGAQQVTHDNGTNNDYPTWSPDSQQIAFVSNESGKSDIWTVNVGGGTAHQLTTNSNADAQSPAWSPDGRQIAYSTNSTHPIGNYEIYLMNTDGTHMQRLTTSDGDSDSPAWSPNGQQIAYVTTQNGEANINLITVDSSSATNLLGITGFVDTLSWSPDAKSIAYTVTDGKKVHAIRIMDVSDPTKTSQLTDADVQASGVSWGALQSIASVPGGNSENGGNSIGNNSGSSSSGVGSPPIALGHFGLGSKIVFTSERSGHRQIYTTDAKGKNLQQLTNSGLNWYPSWSADGHSIAYMCAPLNPTQADIRICVMDENGGHQHKLHHGSGPAWSWDSQRIAFVGGNTELYTMNADGSNEVNLTPGLTAVEPSWSPDDKQIVYTLVHNGTDDIYVVNSDGSNNHQIVAARGLENHSPSWSPDGQHIVFVTKENAVNQIYVIAWNGSAMIQLTHDGSGDVPSWSPDGQYILFVRHGQIFVMNADGSNIHSLLDSGIRDTSPGWQPVGLN